MLDVQVEVNAYCDECGKHKYDVDENYICPDCYEKMKAEHGKLQKENENLRSILKVHGISEEEITPSVYLCPALSSMLGIQGRKL